MAGVFGYELDLTQLTSEEKAEIKEQVAFYKKHRQLLQYGTFYRWKVRLKAMILHGCLSQKTKQKPWSFISDCISRSCASISHIEISRIKQKKQLIKWKM